MNSDFIISLAVLAVVLTVAVYLEVRDSRIPNWLTVAGMAAGLFLAYLRGGGAFRSSLAGLLLGFGFLFIFYVFGGMGGGDVKLMGASGALLGSELIKSALFYTAALGAFMAVAALIWRKDFWNGMRRILAILRLRKRQEPEPVEQERTTIPYGIAIAGGCLVALLMG